MKKGLRLAVVAGAILAVGGLALAGRGAGGLGGSGKARGQRSLASAGQRHPVKFLAWWLDLTPKQITQIEGILAQAEPEAVVNAAAATAAKRALHDAVIDGAANLKIRAAAAVLGQTIADDAVLRAKTLTSIKGVLDADQKKEFEKILTKMPRFGLRLQGHARARAGEPNAPAKAGTETP